MIILGTGLPLLNWAVFLEAAGTVLKIGSSLKPNHHLDQWFPTGVLRHTWVPWTSARGAANCYFSLIFMPIKQVRGAAKYIKYRVRVPQTKKVGNHWSRYKKR